LPRYVEIPLLLLVCGALFLPGMGRFDFIKTEGLRAVVVKEMLEQPGLSMPSVHHRPQLKKPPLYAWTTTLLARAVGHFDERIARLPSAAAGTLLILLLYLAGERGLGRGAGLIAAAFGLTNVTVVDYAARAELDMGFGLFTTVSILLAYEALRARGGSGPRAGPPGSGWRWIACYLAATLAALWKGPHSLIFLWVTLAAYSWRKRNWRWVAAPGHVTGLLVCLGALIAWTIALSGHAGAGNVGKTAAIELVSRLIPLSLAGLVSILYALPVMAAVLLPSSLFVLISLRSGPVYAAEDRPGGRSFRELWRFSRGRASRWWAALAAHPFEEFLLYWLVPNMLWSAVVPAKAPRYWLPMFPPALLLAAAILLRHRATTEAAAAHSRVGGPKPGKDKDHLDLAWRELYRCFGIAGGVVLMVASGAALWSELRHLGKAGSVLTWPWQALGLGWIAVSFINVPRATGPTLPRRCLGLIVVALAVKPVLTHVWWPIRAHDDSQRGPAAQIDAVVPAGEPVFVLGRHELPDVEFYSRRFFQWLDEPTEARAYTSAPDAFYLLRKEDVQDEVTARGFDFQTCLEFIYADLPVYLIRVEMPSPSTHARRPGAAESATGNP